MRAFALTFTSDCNGGGDEAAAPDDQPGPIYTARAFGVDHNVEKRLVRSVWWHRRHVWT
jgi:hypothetical protein